MKALVTRVARFCGAVAIGTVGLLPLNGLTQQPLNLGPLPWVGQLPEFLMPGNGQGFAGLATYYMGQPVILYDSVWVQKLGGLNSAGFRFVRAHEYAHHFRGHMLMKLNSPPQTWPFLGYQEELDADCVAVNYLKKVGDMAAVQAGYQIYKSVLPPFDSQGRPGANNRIQNMNRC